MLCRRAFERLEARGFAVCRGAVPRMLVREVRRHSGLEARLAVLTFLGHRVLPSFLKRSENDLLYDAVSSCPGILSDQAASCPTAWHIDAPARYIGAWLPPTIMVPLTTISAARGNAEQVLEGSHRAPMLHLRGESKSADVEAMLKDATWNALGGRRYVRAPELRPGDLLLLHPRVFHRTDKRLVSYRPRCLWWHPRPETILLRPSARTPIRRPMNAAEAPPNHRPIDEAHAFDYDDHCPLTYSLLSNPDHLDSD